jgi:hypothetical protein
MTLIHNESNQDLIQKNIHASPITGTPSNANYRNTEAALSSENTLCGLHMIQFSETVEREAEGEGPADNSSASNCDVIQCNRHSIVSTHPGCQ